MVSIWVTNTTDMLMLASFYTVAHRLIVFKARSANPWNSKARKMVDVTDNPDRIISLWSHTPNPYDSSQSELEQLDSA